MKILLLCNAGMSTSLLVEKMKKVAENMAIEAVIDALPIEDLDKVIDDYDVLLLGPQVKFKEKMVSELCTAHSKKYAIIPPQAYGMVDGQKALDLALEILKK